MPFVRTIALSDLSPVQGRGVRVGEQAVALFLADGEIFALEDRCPHRDAPIADGWVDDGAAVCPLHHARFELGTGRALCEPAGGDIRAYAVRVVDGFVEVDVD